MFNEAVSKPFPLHKTYELQEDSRIYPKNFKAVAVKAQCLPRPDEILNVDLQAFFMYHREQKKLVYYQGPISKRYVEEIYAMIEKKAEHDSPKLTIESIMFTDTT